VVAGPVVRITSPVAIRACQPCDSQGAVSHPRPAVQVMTAPSTAAAGAAAAARSTPPGWSGHRIEWRGSTFPK